VIVSFRHDGLERFFRAGSVRGINPNHAARLRARLAVMQASNDLDALNVPGWRLHPLRHDRAGQWSIPVNGPWCLVFIPTDFGWAELDYVQYRG